MKKCHGGVEGIIATVILVTLVILVIATSIVGLGEQSGNTVNQAVTGIVDSQHTLQVTPTE